MHEPVCDRVRLTSVKISNGICSKNDSFIPFFRFCFATGKITERPAFSSNSSSNDGHAPASPAFLLPLPEDIGDPVASVPPFDAFMRWHSASNPIFEGWDSFKGLDIVGENFNARRRDRASTGGERRKEERDERTKEGPASG